MQNFHFCHVSMFEDISILHFLTFQNVYNACKLVTWKFISNFTELWCLECEDSLVHTLIVLVLYFTFLSNFGTFSLSNLVSWTFPFYETWWIFFILYLSLTARRIEKNQYFRKFKSKFVVCSLVDFIIFSLMIKHVHKLVIS